MHNKDYKASVLVVMTRPPGVVVVVTGSMIPVKEVVRCNARQLPALL